MCVQHGLKFMYKCIIEVVTCIVHVVLLHSILNYIIFSLFICIIVNIVFILFYLQVEPVFLPACLNKAIQITSVSSISATYPIYI